MAPAGTFSAVPREIDPRQFRLGVASCLFAVGVFLAFRLRSWPPHEDETLALFVGSGSIRELFDTVLSERGGAPLHFLFAWLVAHAGGGLVALRVVSAVFALASIPLIAAIAARLAGRTAALAATVIASMSWILLFHAVYGRMYSLFLFTSALSYVALLRALERGGLGPWAAWTGAIVACVATHPYGALVLASQGVYAFLVVWRRNVSERTQLARAAPSAIEVASARTRPAHAAPSVIEVASARTRPSRRRMREVVLAFAAVAVLGTPFWITDLVLASRFDVGVGGGGARLGGPMPVLEYLVRVAGDFSSGYPLVLALALVLAGIGARRLWRERRDAALLVVCVFAVPSTAFLLARLGGSAVPETRHLIFALPFFATVLALGFLRDHRALAAPAAAIAVLVGAQLAWARTKTPELFSGDPKERVAGRDAAAKWLAQTGRPDDILLGYEPLYLGAWERSDSFSRIVIPRADAKLAAKVLRESPKPLGRGVWVIDAWEKNNAFRRLALPVKYPYPREQFEARGFGPYLVIRTREPTRTPERYLELAQNVQILGKYLWIGDADVNYETVRRAAKRLGID